MKTKSIIRSYYDYDALDSIQMPELEFELTFEVFAGCPAKTNTDPDDCYPAQPVSANFLGNYFENDIDQKLQDFTAELKLKIKEYIKNVADKIEQNPEDYLNLEDI